MTREECGMLLQGKVVVISGVGPGLGQAMARLALEQGAFVALGARNADFLSRLADELAGSDRRVVWRSTDVTKVDECKRLAQAAADSFGRIDALINSAYLHGDWATTDVAESATWATVYDVTCVGALRMAQAVLPAMRGAGGGSIVNVSTMAAVKPFPGEAAYAAAKGGLAALTRHMARDFGRDGIRVNCARLGWIGGAPVFQWIDSQVAAGRDRQAVEREITDRIPLNLIPPETDCARAILALLSDHMRVVTGATLDVNGGEYMAP